MGNKYIIIVFTMLTGSPCRPAAKKLTPRASMSIPDQQATVLPALPRTVFASISKPEPKIGLLAKLYKDPAHEGLADVTPSILKLLTPQDLKILALIGRKKPQLLGTLYQNAIIEL